MDLPRQSPRLLPDIQMIQMFFKPVSHWPASRWAIRALIGRYAERGPAYVTTILLLLFKMFIFVKKTFYIMFYGAALCTHYSIRLKYLQDRHKLSTSSKIIFSFSFRR